MVTTQIVVLVCWIIFVLYWLISATSVKPTQETRGWLAGNWQRILLVELDGPRQRTLRAGVWG